MKRTVKTLLLSLIAFAMVFSSLAIPAFAAGSTTISISQKNMNVGDTLTVTVRINGGEAMYATEADVMYDAAMFRFDSGDSATGGSGAVHIVGTPGGANAQSYSLKFTAISAGDCTISASNVKYVADDEKAATGASVPGIKVGDAVTSPLETTKSGDANLSSLTVSDAMLSPRFTAATTAYTAAVEETVTKVTITAKAASAAASVAGAGAVTLSGDETVKKITVTAEDGTQKVYTVTIRRGEVTDGENDGDTLAVTIGEDAYHVAADISAVSIPNGFAATTADFKSNEVGVLCDAGNNYTLYWLTKDADSSGDFYTYDAVSDTFTLLPYYSLNGVMYIFAKTDEGKIPPTGYRAVTLQLGNSAVDAFAFDDVEFSDFYIIYCFVNAHYGFYRYDESESTMQREPEFSLLSADEAAAKPVDEKGLIARFGEMSTVGKAVILLIALGVLCLIALIVFAVRYFVRRSVPDDDSYDDDFDSVEMGNTFHFDEEPVRPAIRTQTKPEKGDSADDADDTDEE